MILILSSYFMTIFITFYKNMKRGKKHLQAKWVPSMNLIVKTIFSS